MRITITTLVMMAAIVTGMSYAASPSHDAYAQQEEAAAISSIFLDKTILITVTNTGVDNGIPMVSVWFDQADENSVASIKTESGWSSQKTPEGLVAFSTTAPLKVDESAKFGIKTSAAAQGINWMLTDHTGSMIDRGRTLSEAAAIPEEPETVEEEVIEEEEEVIEEEPTPPPPPPPPPPTITSESDFRIIPSKPSVGSTIRVVGEKFGPNYAFAFYIDSRVLGGFTSDENGRYVTTMKIPSDIEADRVNFAVRDIDGEEIVRSLRLDPAAERQQTGAPNIGEENPKVDLVITGMPDTVRIGDRLEVKGTGNPGDAVIVYVTGPDNTLIKSDIVRTDRNGAWSVHDSYLVGTGLKPGDYTTTVTDGTRSTDVQWSITTGKTIEVGVGKVKYERGETIQFEVNTTQSEPLHVQLENPNNAIVYTNILEASTTGATTFEYKVDQDDSDGTYTLIVTQNGNKEFLFVGIGELPKTKIRFDLDKINYKAGDVGLAKIAANPQDTLKFNILDHSDNIAYSEVVHIQTDGRAGITLNLAGFANGIYTAELEKGTEKRSKEFTIGLRSGTSNIDITPIRPPYHPGDQFLISVDTGDASVPLVISMTNPGGEMVSSKETFSKPIRVDKDEDSNKTIESLQIPPNGEFGIWEITATSGGNTNSVPIEVIPSGLYVQILEIRDEPPIGKYADIRVIGAEQTIWLHVVSADGTPIGSEQKVSITGDKTASAKWVVPDDTVPGTYILKVRDTHRNMAEAEIKIE